MKKVLIVLSILLFMSTISLSEEAYESTMTAKRAVLCSQIENREPIDETNSFLVNDRAWFFTEIINAGEEKTIFHIWSHFEDGEEKEMAKVQLRAKGNRWRTWSSKKLFLEGNWNVKVVDSEGNILDKTDFYVDTPSPDLEVQGHEVENSYSDSSEDYSDSEKSAHVIENSLDSDKDFTEE